MELNYSFPDSLFRNTFNDKFFYFFFRL